MAKGDHIRARRLGGLYTHHGIDVGDGTVVHFDGDPFRRADARVRRVPVEEFAKGATVKTVSHVGTSHDADEVIARALHRLGEGGYDLLRNNCEHFARACKTGAPRSRQVEKAVRAGVAAAGIALVGGVAALALLRKQRNSSGGHA